jgi:hypothetical protein
VKYASCAGIRCEPQGLDYIERTARRNATGREVVPLAQLFDGDAEAIGDGYEGVGTAHDVTPPGCEASARSDRDDELIAGLDRVSRSQVIE